MENKMAESRNILGGAIASRLNFPIMQKIEDKLFFVQQTFSRIKYKKAFSIAEAMISLTIVSVIAASVAPMISKQIKINEMSDVQASVLSQKIENLNSELKTLKDNLNTEEDTKDKTPVGVIVMWSGSNIPTDWALCDGTNGTPDLRNRFIVGAGDEYDTGTIGGYKEVALTIEQMPKHDHGVMEYSGPWKTGVENNNSHIAAGTNGWSSSYTSFTGGQTDGTTKPHENRPPYYALAYIMKIK